MNKTASQQSARGASSAQTQATEMRAPGPAGPFAGMFGLQRAAGNRAVGGLIQRKGADAEGVCPVCGRRGSGVCPDCGQPFARVQRKEDEGGRPAADGLAAVASALQAGDSFPLDKATRELMEARFSHSFGHVRVHTSQRAAASARAIHALAYAVGNNIVFGAGQYSPTTLQGQYLLAHELAHVVQQRSAIQPAELALDPPSSPLEQQADLLASRAMMGEPARLGAAGSGLPGLVLRHAADKTICPSPPQWRIVDARPKDVNGPANQAIELAYVNDPRHRNHAVLTGSEFEYGGNKEIRLPKGTADRKAGDAILSRLRGLVKQRAPDIANFTERVFYEIKTPRYAASGLVQLESYYALTDVIRQELGAEGGPPWDQGAATWYPPHVLPFPGNLNRVVCTQMTDYSVTSPGLILYVVLEKQKQDEEEEKKKQAQEVAKPEQTQEQEDQGQSSKLPMVAVGAGGAALTAGAIALLRRRAQEAAARRAAQLAWRKAAEAAAERRAAQAAGKGALGKVAGKAVAYAEIAAAAALIIFYSDRVEAKIGPGSSPIETLYKAMTTSGTPPSPELKQLIESDPLLKQLAEDAGSSGNSTPLQQEMMRRTLQLIHDNPDAFTPEDLEFLMKYSNAAAASGEAPKTVEQLRKAIDAARAGKSSGKGSGAGSGKGSGEAKENQQPAEGKPSSSDKGATDATAISAESRKRLEAASGPVRTLFSAITSAEHKGPPVSDSFVDAYLKIIASATPPLSDADVAKLRSQVIPAGEAIDENQILANLRKAMAQRQATPGERDKKPGDAKAEGQSSGGQGDKKPGDAKAEGQTGEGEKKPGAVHGSSGGQGDKKKSQSKADSGATDPKAARSGTKKDGGSGPVPVDIKVRGAEEGGTASTPKTPQSNMIGAQLIAGLSIGDRIPQQGGLKRTVTIQVYDGKRNYTVAVSATFTQRIESKAAVTFAGTLEETYDIFAKDAGPDDAPLLTLPKGAPISLPFHTPKQR